MVELYPHQERALDQLDVGKVLWGGVGSGKTITALAFYYENFSDKDLYVITTARKRDDLDWDKEASKYGIGTRPDATTAGTLRVDSWNNVSKYVNVKDAFFIFDEQRVVGSGTWVKSFLRIARNNDWILLSATPGDQWIDYVPLFIANGWYKNATQFKQDHVLYAPFVRYPKIQGYLGTEKLNRLRSQLLVHMPYKRHTIRNMNYLQTGFDRDMWNVAVKERRNPFNDEPIKDVAELFRIMRRIVNSDPSKLEMLLKLTQCHNRLVVFYNFNYELEALRTLGDQIHIGEYNGHRKDSLPECERWLYLVQYQAGSEGWNCTSTDAMVLYSLTYSFRNHEQALGRIDRLDTKFVDLYYYVLATSAPIDNAIRRSLDSKETFNESAVASNVTRWVV